MKHLLILINLIINLHAYSQTIVEGKGIDQIHLGLKKSKVIQLLGNNYKNITYDYGHTGLVYENERVEIQFDKYDDVSFEIIIFPDYQGKTTKGLEASKDLTVKEIFNVYGDEWSIYKDTTIIIQYDFGISFKTNYSPAFEEKNFSKNKNFLNAKILSLSIIENEDDNTFQEYLDGQYIPLNINETYSELIRLIPPEDILTYKMQALEDFLSNTHFGIGKNIRNNWMLWKGSRLAQFFIKQGLIHPDDMSALILTNFHFIINNKTFDLEKEIRKYKKS